jgi:hypothetical protein
MAHRRRCWCRPPSLLDGTRPCGAPHTNYTPGTANAGSTAVRFASCKQGIRAIARHPCNSKASVQYQGICAIARYPCDSKAMHPCDSKVSTRQQRIQASTRQQSMHLLTLVSAISSSAVQAPETVFRYLHGCEQRTQPLHCHVCTMTRLHIEVLATQHAPHEHVSLSITITTGESTFLWCQTEP